MSLDKSILYKKEHRKPYYGCKAIDMSCRNHGGCIYCLNNRTHKYNVKIESLKAQEKEYRKGEI